MFLAEDGIYSDGFGHCRKWLSFLGIFPICKIYMLLNFCFSPDILALIMEKEGSTKNQKGRGKLFFLLYTCKAIILNSGQEWKVSPWKTGISVRCICLSERTQSEEAEYSMTPLMTFLEKQIYTDVKRDPGVGNLKWSFRWIPVNMHLVNISSYSLRGQSWSIHISFFRL